MPDQFLHSFPARRTGLAAAALACLLALAACGGGGAAAGPGGPGGMPPPSVGVVTVQPASVEMLTELPGRLEAWRTAQVRARIPGIVNKRLYTEGAMVKAGQALFEIDPAPFQAALDSALASVARAEASVAQAQSVVERNRPLAAAQVVSDAEWVANQNALKQAQADLAATQAAVAAARINLGHASVRAPIAGFIGRAQVTEGALVGQGDATLLATIQQTQSMYVNFTQSASEAMRLRRAYEAGQFKRVGGAGAEVRLVLDDGSVYPRAGKLLFSDLSVDAGTGQVTLRAEVPNPDGLLLPGLYVKVRLAQAKADGGMLVPQQAVTRGGAGGADILMVVGEGNMPAPRPVKIGGANGQDWVVLDGLKAGDQVIVDGFQKMRPNTPVTPVPWTPGGAKPAGAPAVAASAAAAAPAASAASAR
ncbi:efflux RND transporter periplasmic adaptor subunit [Leptothrix discophora]|uniref:Efflux RND transporter periplasmic adaptor subunit n=1 Tax=Leptothrix discophora TaxID=89 RepID=A0ABT9G4S7_LEPDI|nr:efflux RND transporter periplasmic adaptor subunit [Leptothrix discophora]MDP4301203.1 efflux RND transporter periplasmic adaptor subunit [Leptothrix discophora]